MAEGMKDIVYNRFFPQSFDHIDDLETLESHVSIIIN